MADWPYKGHGLPYWQVKEPFYIIFSYKRHLKKYLDKFVKTAYLKEHNNTSGSNIR